MSFFRCARSAEDPVVLVESCQKALLWILSTHQGKTLRRCWIDQPYGEEEITRLEQELLPAMEQFLARIGEIDARLEAARQAEIERLQSAMAAAS